MIYTVKIINCRLDKRRNQNTTIWFSPLSFGLPYNCYLSADDIFHLIFKHKWWGQRIIPNGNTQIKVKKW